MQLRPSHDRSDKERSQSGSRLLKVRECLYHILEEFEEQSGESLSLKVCVAGGMVVMILVSLVCLVLETEPGLAGTPPEVWATAEAVTTSCFTVEYLLRLWVCDVYGLSMVAWVMRPMNVCDLLAIVPFYAEFFVNSDISWLRVLRVVRLVKLGRYSQGVQVMTMALVNSMPALYILIFIFIMGMVMFASIVYFTEKFSCPEFGSGKDWGLTDFRLYNEECELAGGGDGTSPTFGTCCAYQCRFMPSPSPSLCQYAWQDDQIGMHTRRLLNATLQAEAADWEANPMHELAFSSVFTAMWWACVTMTTVGYGDMWPKNWLSKCVASVAMITGMLIIAMPFAIVGTKFGEAVAVCEAGDRRTAAAARLKKVRQFGGVAALQASPSQQSMGKEDQMCFEELKQALKASMELKQEILRVQQLRDNLWTSVEHAMANFTLESIHCLSQEILVDDNSHEQKHDSNRLCEWSCFIFHRDSCVRRLAIRLSRSAAFEYLVITAIVVNSVLMANLDYYPREQLPWENELHQRTEIPFIVFFTCECITKIVAQGFMLDDNSYMRDAWNWIDFVVVVTGLALTFSEIGANGSGDQPDLAILRVVRVLRPLRTLSHLPDMRKLVNTILRSLPGLKDVVLLALFLLAIFGILGLHFYGGLMHRRCRVTPQPLHFTPNAPEPSCLGWCFDNSSLTTVDLGNGGRSAQIDSTLVFGAFCSQVPACVQAFTEGRDYYVWPVEPSQDRFCGEYECQAVGADVTEGWAFGGVGAAELVAGVLEPLGAVEDVRGSRRVRTTCGSPLDDDPVYSPKAANQELDGVYLDAPEAEVNSSSFNWGLTHYDQIGGASLVVFQCVTLEGWVDIMYMLQDAYSGLLGFLYFLLLIIIGYFFLLNIILAIVYDAFCDAEASQQQSLLIEEAMEPEAGEESATAKAAGGEVVAQRSDSMQEVMQDLNITGDEFHQVIQKRRWAAFKESSFDVCAKLLRRKSAGDVDALLKQPHPWKIRNCARWLASSAIFDCFVMLIISLNVVVLSLDKFPTNVLFDRFAIEGLNRAFNVIFITEFLILHAAVGPLVYWCDNALAFDGVIVLLSLPDELMVIVGESASGSLQAIRAFRLLRIFKLAKKFPSMKVLLKACVQTLLCMREFVLLLAIVVSVFALIGQSFFGGTFLFDQDGGVIPPEEFEQRCPFGEGGRGKPECVPRAHFDTFLWSIVTIFQILTGENWNTVMYDGMRATHWYALFFFVGVMIMGQFVILNLCLSILMMNFEVHRNTIAAVEQEKRRQQKEDAKDRDLTRKIVSRMKADKTESDLGEADPAAASFSTSSGVPPFDGARNRPSAGSRLLSMFRPRTMRAKSCPVLPDAPPQPRHEQVVPEEFAEEALLRRRSKSSPLNPRAWEQDPRAAAVPQGAAAASGAELTVESVSETGQPDSQCQPQGAPALGSAGHATGSGGATGDDALPEGALLPGQPSHDDLSPPEQAPERVASPDPDADSVTGSLALQNPAAQTFLRYITTHTSFELMPQGHQAEEQIADTEPDMPNLERLIPKRIATTKHFSSLKRRSCFIFDDAHPLRHLCLYIAKDSRFEKVIIALITVSSALMMLQNPLDDPAGTKEVVLAWANVAFTIVFAMEMVIKMTAFGMFCGQPSRPAYLQSSWNVLDASIVTVSLADVLQNHLASDTGGGVLGFMKVFRIARVLRPLRLISRNENLKVVVKTIGSSLPELRNLSVFSSLFFLIFALLGVSNLKGSLYRCLDSKLADYPFDPLGGVTPLCVPPVASAQVTSADIDLAMQFTRQQTTVPGQPLCPATWESWQRPTPDTPICEVHCSSEADHPFCSRSDRPWGYHTMRCTDCSLEFCPTAGADPEHSDSCRQFCDRHEYFCQDSGDPGRPACLEQCVAECLCQDRCVGLSQDAALCAEQGGRWINMNQNFDDLGMGMISLFEICTTEGWVDLMVASADFQGPYRQPRRDAHEFLACSLSVAFILIGSFFVLNLCVGVIIDNYNKQTERTARLMVTEAQSSWITYQKALYAKRTFFVQTNVHLLPPTRQHLMRIVTSQAFENLIMVCIILNTMVLGLVIYPRPSTTYVLMLDRLNIVFAFVFNVEAVMKLSAMHLAYFQERWNVFDFVCVVVSDVFLIVEAAADGANVQIGNVIKGIRIFRIARLFRLVRFLKGLNQLTMAFILSVPKLANVGFIMLLLIYLFAVLGVNVFAEVAYIEGRSYNDNANFRSFWMAISLLVRSMTGEGWNAIMHDLSKDKFYYESYLNVQCVESLQFTAANFQDVDRNGDGVVDPEFINGCGKKVQATVYFITYTLIVTFVILNLFIAVIFEGFEESSKSEVSDLLEKCVEAWRRYDPNSTMFVSLDQALDFIDEVVDQVCHHQAKDDDPNFSMESRWDSSYTGMRTDVQPLALYNLRYMRIIALSTTTSHEVRFVVAVKAVIRRIICQGGLRGRAVTAAGRVERLHELEALDRLIITPEGPTGLDKEMLKLKRKEVKQARIISSMLDSKSSWPGSLSMWPTKRTSTNSSSGSLCSKEGDHGFEYSLLQEVAAAKIQRRFKEAFQRRRARQRSKNQTSHITIAQSRLHAPIARAAG